MERLLNGMINAITAGAAVFTATANLLIKNPIFLGLTALILITKNKSLKLGRIFSVRT